MSRLESMTTTQIRAEIAAAAGGGGGGGSMFDAAVRATSSSALYTRFTGMGYSRAKFSGFTFQAVNDAFPLLPVSYGSESTTDHSSFSPDEGEGGLFIARHTVQVNFSGTAPGTFAEFMVSTYFDWFSMVNRIPVGPGYFAGVAVGECVGTIVTPPFYTPGISTDDDSGYLWNYLYFGDETSTFEFPPSKSVIELFRIKQMDNLP